MPIIKSSMKDIRRTKRRNARNSAEKNKLRTLMKNVLGAKTADEASQNLKLAVQALDKAWSHGILKRGTVSRQVARLSSFVHKKYPK